MTRRRLLHAGLAGSIALVLPGTGHPASKPPFSRLAVPEPPFDERYEVLVAMAPPLARGSLGKVVTHLATAADAELKTERLTEALDPARTRLHENFVLELADTLADSGARVLRVQVDAADTEAALLAQLRDIAPKADGVLLANVMGRFVAMHGLDDYAPGVIVGVKAFEPRSGKVWLEQIYTAGFRGVDPRASHLEVVDMPERFDNASTLLLHADRAREALIRGVEAIGAEVGRRLLAGP